MRILKVHNYYTMSGGEDTVFQAESSLLLARGHQVISYLEFNKKIESMNKASVALDTIWSQKSYKKLNGFLREKKPDVVHFHNTFPLISPSAYYACKDAGIPVVQTLDNQRLICPAASFYRNGKLCLDCLNKTPPWPGVLHACYHNSRVHTAVVVSMLTFHRWMHTWKSKIDIFLCSTMFYRDLFVTAGLPSDKIVVMPHFVQPKQQSETREKKRDYALFVGRLDPEKGIRTLLESWLHLEYPLKIRGNGRLEESARSFVQENNMDNVEFVERLDDNGLADLVENARFLVMPSEGYYETFGMVIIEAYSRGVPVLASNIGVVPEIVLDKQTGVLFEAGNVIDLAEKARWMWSHRDEVDTMGRRGLKMYQEKFTPDQCYQTLIEVYKRVISSG